MLLGNKVLNRALFEELKMAKQHGLIKSFVAYLKN
jgi:hypothetical protein